MSEKDISSLIIRYKEAQELGKQAYFDADEFCDLAEYFDSQDELETAQRIIKDGLAIHPGNTSLLTKKAKILVYEGDYENALELLQSSSDYDFDLYLLKIECYLQLDDYTQAYKLSEELIEKEDSEPKESIFSELGFIYVEAEYFNDAVKYFEESLKYNQEDIDVLSDMAYAYEMLGDFNKAIETTNKLLDVEPYTYEAWVNLGKLYSLGEEYEKAIDAFDFALTINDTDNSVLKLKAHCLSLVERTEEAIEIFNDLLLSTPEDTSLYLLLAECYLSLKMLDEAIPIIEKYEEIAGETIEIISKKIDIFLQKEDFDGAYEAVKQGLLLYPDSSDLNMIAGEIAFRQEKYDEARAFYLGIYAHNKENFHLIDRLAIINIKQESYQVAIYYTEKLLEIAPGNIGVRERLALLYFEVDDKELFNTLLNQFTDEELLSLFQLIYTPRSPKSFDRDMLIFYLNRAREARTLFKNLKY